MFSQVWSGRRGLRPISKLSFQVMLHQGQLRLGKCKVASSDLTVIVGGDREGSHRQGGRAIPRVTGDTSH